MLSPEPSDAESLAGFERWTASSETYVELLSVQIAYHAGIEPAIAAAWLDKGARFDDD
jgi:hypothetical protein